MEDDTIINSIETVVSLLLGDNLINENFLQRNTTLSPAVGLMLTSKSRESRARTKAFLEMLPLLSDSDFKSHFRLHRSSIEVVVQLFIKNHNQQSIGRARVSPDTIVLVGIWVLANQESFRGVAARFGIERGHCHRLFMEFVSTICSIRREYIHWASDVQQNINEFGGLRLISFPGIVGCVDGTQINIPSPIVDSGSYYDRKGNHSIKLQIICNANKLIMDAFAGWPGSSNDARVWQNSPIYKHLEEEPERYLRGGDNHILGDSAYPLDTFLLSPYRDTGRMTRVQRKFNQILSSHRVIVEQSIGTLKGRFRRLKYLDMVSMPKIASVLISACVLHNICIMLDDQEEDIVPDVYDDDDINVISNRRTIASAKRDNIASQL